MKPVQAFIVTSYIKHWKNIFIEKFLYLSVAASTIKLSFYVTLSEAVPSIIMTVILSDSTAASATEMTPELLLTCDEVRFGVLDWESMHYSNYNFTPQDSVYSEESGTFKTIHILMYIVPQAQTQFVFIQHLMAGFVLNFSPP